MVPEDFKKFHKKISSHVEIINMVDKKNKKKLFGRQSQGQKSSGYTSTAWILRRTLAASSRTGFTIVE